MPITVSHFPGARRLQLGLLDLHNKAAYFETLKSSVLWFVVRGKHDESETLLSSPALRVC